MNLAEAFAVLDVSPEAAMTEIDSAYKAAVQAWHPDRFARTPNMQGVAEAKLKRLNEAYSVLCAPRESVHTEPTNCTDDQVLYQGFDPRLRQVGQNEPAGRPAETHILEQMLVLVTRRAGVFTRVTEYPYETIQRLSHGETRWQSSDAVSADATPHPSDPRLCVLEAALPDGPQRRTLVSLTFRDDQAAARFARRMISALQQNRPATSTTPRPRPSQEHQRKFAASRAPAADFQRSHRSTPPAGYAYLRPRGAWSGWLGALFVVLMAALAAVAAAAVLPWPLPQSSEALPFEMAPEPELVVWTEPDMPALNQPYTVCIRLQLPPGVLPPDDVYSPLEDLLLVVTASDGTTSYETFKYVLPVAAPGGQTEIRIPAPILDTSSDAGESLEVYSRLIGRWVSHTVREPREPVRETP